MSQGDRYCSKLLRFVVLVGRRVLSWCFTGILDLTWPQQLVLGLLTVLLAIWMDRSSSSYLVTLTLMLVSMYSTFRYGFWRISYTIKFFHDPGNHVELCWTRSSSGCWWWRRLRVCACCSWATCRRCGRCAARRCRCRTTPSMWPAVDLLIPTYNEPLSVVRYTALAAMNIDWPADKLNVYILDDGKREEFRQFAEEAGIGYMTRDDNKHAKAGNINRALERLDRLMSRSSIATTCRRAAFCR